MHKNKVQLQLRLSPKLHKRLKKTQGDASLNSHILTLLEAALRDSKIRKIIREELRKELGASPTRSTTDAPTES